MKGVGLTLDGSQDDTGVVVGDDVGITIFGLVHLQVGVFPGELLPRIDRLMRVQGRRCMHTHTEKIAQGKKKKKKRRKISYWNIMCCLNVSVCV